MKIGLLACAYNCPETIKGCLSPWIELSEELDIEIIVVSTPFKDFPTKENTPTISKIVEIMMGQKRGGIVDNPIPLPEHDARNMGLIYLQHKKVDVVWLLDSDEFYTKEEIRGIVEMVKKNPLVVWWRIPFKNYIFDGKQWIEGFTPPRIFRTQVGNKVLHEFYWDNDVNYRNIAETQTFDYMSLASSLIPTSKAHVRHMTWLHTNGKDKVDYQLKHFGHCSYKWNEAENKLELDKDFYRIHNQPLPIIHTD